jgi:hypothetical protein
MRDEPSPIERLPAPPEVVVDATPMPPPPPPPPRGGEPTDPPARVGAIVHHERCRVVIGGVEESAARAAAFLDRLGRRTSWTTGIVGCMSSAPTPIRITCGPESLTLFDSCSNILDDSGVVIGTWSPEMNHWYHDPDGGSRTR